MDVRRWSPWVVAATQGIVHTQRVPGFLGYTAKLLDVLGLSQSNGDLFLQCFGLWIHEQHDREPRPVRHLQARDERLEDGSRAEVLSFDVDELLGRGDCVHEQLLNFLNRLAFTSRI